MIFLLFLFFFSLPLDGLGENSICTFAVCSARYKTRPGLVYHYGHSHSTSSGDPAKELSPSPADVESRSVGDTAASDQPGWTQNQAQFSQFPLRRFYSK